MAWLSGYNQRIKLTVDHTKIDAGLSDFPLMVYLSVSSGMSSEDVTDVFDELGSDANRKKIAITTSDGTTQCYVEIERWDHANEKAWLHVKAPSLSSDADSDLYLYYDSTAANNTAYVGDAGESPAQSVWDDYFEGVWHLGQDPSGGADCIKDSTANANHGTPNGSMTSGDLVDGLAGKALDFDGSDDFVDVGNDSSLEVAGSNFTVEAVAKWTAGYNAAGIIGMGAMTTDYGLTLGYNDASKVGFLYSGSTWAYNAGGGLNDGDFHHISGKLAGGSPSIFVDAVSESFSTGGASAGSYNAIGEGYAGNKFNGVIDEVRISSTDRSDAWIKATCNTLFDSLLTLSLEFGQTTEFEDASLDLAAYYRKSQDLASFLRAHDGIELHDLKSKLEASGWNVEDLKAFLSAYYQGMEDAGMDLLTWGTHYDDLKSFLAAFFQRVEDFKASLETWGTAYSDHRTMLEAADWSTEDLTPWLCAWGRKLSSLGTDLWAAKQGFENLAAFLAATDGIVLKDLGVFLEVTDGAVTNDLGLYLKVIQSIPAFRSVTAQKVSSVVHEVN